MSPVIDGVLEGYRLEEIAEITAVSIGAVKSRMHRAKRNLRRHGAMGTGIAWAMALSMFILIGMLAFTLPDKQIGILMMLSTIGYLIMGLAFLVQHLIKESTAKVREDEVRLQLQPAELEEKLLAGTDSQPW